MDETDPIQDIFNNVNSYSPLAGKEAETGCDLSYDEDFHSSDDGDVSGSDENGFDNSAQNEDEKNLKLGQESNHLGASSKIRRGQKRRKASNKRRNIRKVLRIDQLDPRTLEAQREEQERLHRLELQRSISDKQVELQRNILEQTPELQKNVVENAHGQPAALDTLENENHDADHGEQAILIIDDDNDDVKGTICDSESQESIQSQKDTLDAEKANCDNVILILSSDSEEENDIGDEQDSDSTDECRNLITTTNFKTENGDILVNTGHPADEPDIFLPPQISRTIKPHQILGIRFLYENLIESVKTFKANHGVGCILAHAMGLGKTIQTVSLVHIFLMFTQARKVLILVPINTLQNWLNEFNMWLPEASKGETNTSNCTEVRRDSCFMGDEMSRDSISSQDINLKQDVDWAKMGLNSAERSCAEDVESSYEQERLDAGCKAMNNDASKECKIGEKANDSQNSESCAKKENVEYRNYEVFLINDGQKGTTARAKIIGQWHKNGGVLIMGYEMFRMIAMYTPSLCNSVTNAKGKRKKQAKKSAAVIDIDEEEKEMQLFLGMQRALCKPGPDLVVCDEGHRIKNHQSNIHHALHKIETRKRLVLTGYPLQNNLTEYWCMVDFVRPNYLGSRQEFQNMFERPIVNGQCIDSTIDDKRLMKYRAHVLSSLLKGFVQRSDYTTLKVALPPKQEHVITIRLSTVQQAVYRRFLELMQEGYGDQLNPIKIFAVCSKIWNHPDILFKAMKADLSKRDVLFETDEDTVTEDGTKTSKNFKAIPKEARNSPMPTNDEGATGTDARSLLSKITDWAKVIFDSHQYKEGLVEMSGKFIVLLEIMNESFARGDKLLVFSQSLLTLDLIEEFLNRIPVIEYGEECNQNRNEGRTWTKNLDYFRIDGNTSSSERERLIDLFNKKDNLTAKLFLLSTRAGCLGINLVGANRVVVFDVSWNPCHDAQAVCRVYRYGQIKPCYIYRLIASNTMEKRMYYRQISKQGVSDRVIDELNPIENFTKDELHKLLSTSWDDEPEKDYTEDCNAMNDPVLKRVCQTCAHWIVSLPFKHESLLQDEKTSKLSIREKREAKRGYEEEKRKAAYGLNGPATIRGPPFMQRTHVQYPTGSPQAFSNYATWSTNGQIQHHPIMSNHPMNFMNLQTSAALANILRRAELLRQYNASTQGNELTIADPKNSLQMSQFFDPSISNSYVQSPTISVAQNATTAVNAVQSPTSSVSLNVPSPYHSSVSLTGLPAMLPPIETVASPNPGGVIACGPSDGAHHVFDGENDMTDLLDEDESSCGANGVEVICIDSDDDN